MLYKDVETRINLIEELYTLTENNKNDNLDKCINKIEDLLIKYEIHIENLENYIENLEENIKYH